MLVLEGHAAPVYALAFSPDGRFLASGAKDCTVRIWDESLTGAELLHAGRDIPVPVNALTWAPSGSRLAIATGTQLFDVHYPPDDTTFLWGLGSSAAAVEYVTEHLVAVGFGHRAKPEPGELSLWDLHQKKRREPHFRAMYGVRAIATHPPTKRVAWAEWGGRLHNGPRMFVWDIAKPDPIRFNLTHKAASLAFHPEGQQLAAAIDYEVRVYDLDRKQERFRRREHKATVMCVAASPDGRTFASGSWDGSVRLWEWATGAEIACYKWPVGKVNALAYSPDGLRVAVAGDEGRIVMWDAA